jgi:3-carboxy-cis,cis-muconate cycloisomerase
MGRQQAHDLVYEACHTVHQQGGSLSQVLATIPAVTALFDLAAIEQMTDPANYLGMAPQMVDEAIARSAQTPS